MQIKVHKSYSLAFKHHVVAEYEAGASAHELAQRYGITGSPTIARWIRQYSRTGVKHKMMHIQSPEEADQLKVLQAELAQAKAALAELSVENFMLKASLAVAEKELGYEVKKRLPTSSSPKPAASKPKAQPRSP